MKKNHRFLASFLGSLAILAGCTASQTTDTQPQEEQITPDIEVSDQELTGDMVKISQVMIDKNGWVTIHIDNNGAPGEVIGYSLIEKGSQNNVEVKLDKAKATSTVYAMLHYDNGNAAVYEFPGVDEPVKVDGNIVMEDFKLTNIEPGKSTEPSSMMPADNNTDVKEMEVNEEDKMENNEYDNKKSTEEKNEAAVKTEMKAEVNADVSAKTEASSEPPLKSFNLEAKKFEFVPGTITVNQGDKVRLVIKSTDVEHGIKIGDFGVNETIPAGGTVTVEFMADKKGTFSMSCSSYCGDGHPNMKGTLIVQ